MQSPNVSKLEKYTSFVVISGATLINEKIHLKSKLKKDKFKDMAHQGKTFKKVFASIRDYYNNVLHI